MGELFNLTNDIRDKMTAGFNDLLGFLGRSCTLYYPPIQESCDNCIYDPIGNKSSNKWLHGGPMPFDFGMCPVCGGVGTRAISQTENITMQFNFNAAQWKKMPIPNIQLVDGLVLSKGLIGDYPKVRNSIYMEAALDLNNLVNLRYQLYGEPLDVYSICRGKYFTTFWKRIG